MNVIRWGTLIYIMVCLVISVNLQAQENHVPLQKQVRITNTLFSIDSLSRLITAQTGVFLSFNSNKIAAGEKIVTQKRLYAVEELLELIKSNTGSGYKIYQDHVIFHGSDKQGNKLSSAKATTTTGTTDKSKPLSVKNTTTYETKTTTTSGKTDKTKPTLTNASEVKATKQSSETKATTTSGKPDKPKPFSAKNATTSETKTTATSERTDKPRLSSAKTTDTIETSKKPSDTKSKATPFPLEPLKPQPPRLQITLTQKPSFTAQRHETFSREKKTRWFADGGFTVDDVLYLNPSITAGHKFLHGFISYSSSFKVSGFRYGLGSMIPLNDEWRIGLLVTTGKLNREIDFTGVRDTLKNITVKSELYRLAIQVERSIRPHLIVKAGPVFNLLKSSYFQEGRPVTIATSGYEGSNADKEVYTVRPLYTLSNSYKATEPTNTKTWIGFQVSLCYRFNF